MREQMIAATKPGADGLPVFNLFVRTKRANVSMILSSWLSIVLAPPQRSRYSFLSRCGIRVAVSRAMIVLRPWLRIMPTTV